MAGMTRRIAMSPIPTTIQLSIAESLSGSNLGRHSGPPTRSTKRKVDRSTFSLGALQPPRRRHASAAKTKGRPKPAFEINHKQNLRLLRSDRVLRGLGDAELHHGLGLDLDGFAGLRIPSHAGFAVGLHQAAQSGDNEHAVLLRLFDSRIGQVLQERRGLLVVEFILFRQKADELRFGQTRCHVLPPRKKCDVIPLAAILLPQPCGKTPDFTRVWQMWYVEEGLFMRCSIDRDRKSGIKSVFADENQLRVHPETPRHREKQNQQSGGCARS